MTFDQTFDDVADVQGWMTEDQAHRLWDRAQELAAPSQIVEIGSYQGRSAIVFGRAAADGVATTVAPSRSRASPTRDRLTTRRSWPTWPPPG